MGDGLVDGLGCVLEQVGEADMKTALAESDGGVKGGEATKTDVQRRDRGAGAKVAVLLLEDGDQSGGHAYWKVNMEGCGCWLTWDVDGLVGGLLLGWVGQEPDALLLDEAGGVFAEVADGFQGQFTGYGVGVVFRR